MSKELAALIRMGRNVFSEADRLRAERYLLDALAGGAKYPDIHYTLGLIDHQRGNYPKAVEYFRRAVEINPDYTEALFSLSITLNDMGRYDEAREAYGRASGVLARRGAHPRENMFRGRIADLYMELGDLFLALGQHDESIREYRNALSVAPGYVDLRIRLVSALRESGRTEEALKEADALLEESPNNPAALIQKGILHYLSGDRPLARRAWEEALYRAPLNKIVQVYLNTLDRENRPD